MHVSAIGCVTMDDPILRQLLLEAVYEGYDDSPALAALDEYLEQVDSPGFAKSHGYACPYCDSVCVNYIGDVYLEGDTIHHYCACCLCDEVWIESYDITGYLYTSGV